MAQQRKQYDSVFKQKAVELADARGNARQKSMVQVVFLERGVQK
jgi:hypothetical protein